MHNKVRSRLSQETAELLRTCAARANRATGVGHPLDEVRWQKFIIAAHKENAEFSPSDLERWLVRDASWDPETASELALKYAEGRHLLVVRVSSSFAVSMTHLLATCTLASP